MLRKIFIPFLLILSLLVVMPNASAQKNQKKNKAKDKTTVITDETRQQSSMFADALREFYAGNYEAAENTFRKVLSKNEKNDAIYYMLARIRKEGKNYSGAAYYLNEAIKLDKSNVWYKVELAEVYDLMEDYKNSTKLWEEICKLKPENEYYLFTLSENYINLEEYTKVIDVYNKLEVLDGYNDEITDAKVKIWLYLNNIKNAVGEYDKLIKEFPSEPRYYVLAGDICQSNNMPEKALSYYQSALKIDPNNTMANMAIANYYSETGDEKAAYQSLRKAFADPLISLDDKLPFLKSYFSKAVRTPNQENISRCRELALNASVAHPERVEVWATMASLCLIEKDYDTARGYFDRAVTIDQSSYALWEDYIFCLSKQQDYKSMISKGQTALELFPTNAAMLYNIANAYYFEKEYTKAIELLQQAAVYSYDNNLLANIYNVLGDCHKELGHKEEAVKNWKTAQQKGLNTQEKIKELDN
ncbi:MAG: tetratricopeptide repeat protein [Bacteroidales bacterium]|nr:tetratricopeptide repeat protein [Bacteroidales bacterium]